MKNRFNDVKIESKNIDVRILSHKDFQPLGQEIYQEKKKTKKNKTIFFTIASFVFLIIFLYSSHLFSSANVLINKNTTNFEFSNEVINISQSTESILPFTVVKVDDVHHESVVPDVLNASAQKAKGKVTIYNSHSKSRINLKKGSVFIANNNIRFVSDQAVTIPGYTTDSNKQIVPGKVEVAITAQNTGSISNIGNADLVLSNYQRQKNKIYARTIETISGGSDQMAYGMSESLKKTISEKIDSELKKSLFIRAEAEIPDDYILYKDMMIYEPKNLVIAGTPQTLDVSKEASLIAYVVKRKDIERLIESKIKDQKIFSPQYLGIDELSVKPLSEPENTINPELIAVNITGSVKIVSYVNTTELAKNISNITKQKAHKTLSEVKGISNYDIQIRPRYLWLMPKNSNRIKIIDVNDK